MRKVIVLAALLIAAPSYAGPPEKGEGSVTLLGGLRFVLPSNADYLSDPGQVGATHTPLTPAGIASFGYQFDNELHFKIEVGYLSDKYSNPAGDLTIRSIPIFLGLDTVLVKNERLTFYGGGGIGYLLNTGSRNGVNNEANSTAGYLSLGLRVQLGGVAAFVVEDRYILASAAVDASDPGRTLTVGGNLVLAGIMFHFFEKDDHPMHP
jgi:hypothetical protein